MAVEAAALPAARPRTATYVGLGVVTFATLVYEIGLTRIFSATMHYHFAFVAISLGLFGMTVGALMVYLRPARFPQERVKQQLWLFSVLFAISVPICLSIQLLLPFYPDWNVGGLLSVLATCAVISVPFVFSGVVVCLALTRFPDRVNRLYAADLVGAAIGCVGFVILLRWFDGPSAVLSIGAIGALGALCFSSDAGGRRRMWISAVALVVIGGVAIANGVLANDGDAFVKVRYAKGNEDHKHFYEDWNTFSRVTVWGDRTVKGNPVGWGLSRTLPKDMLVNQLGLAIDTGAGTVLTGYDGGPEETDFLRYDITNLAHYAKPDADVLVIGVGGGRDVLSALEFEQNSVTGVELNNDILKLTNDKFGDFTGHLDRNPKVTFVNDEARSFLARTDTQYDLIQISLIDTWAATAAGAYALSENSLYTTDAFEVFFESLKDGGMLSISRWFSINDLPPLETYRTLALAAESLKRLGVENPRDHILVYESPPNVVGMTVATILVSPTPLTADTFDAVDTAAVDELEFTPILTPEFSDNRRFEQITAPQGPDAVISEFSEDISASTDDRPFFFQMADLDTFLSGRGFRQDHITRPVQVLGVLGFAVVLLALLCIVVPMVTTRKRSSTKGVMPYYTFFAGIGLGFLVVEISQLQRLSVFLGSPVYALTVVLFSLLLASGVGSMFADRFIVAGRERLALVPFGALVALLVVFNFLEPSLIRSFASETTPMRILVAVLLLVPLGLLMGMPFSIGMRIATRKLDEPPTAFFWGINGATSVCASVLAMLTSLFFGITVTMWFGTLAYVLAATGLVVALRAGPPIRTEGGPTPSAPTEAESAVATPGVAAGVGD